MKSLVTFFTLATVIAFAYVALRGTAHTDVGHSVRSVMHGPLEVRLTKFAVADIYDDSGTAPDCVQVDIWCVIRRVDGLNIDHENDIVLGSAQLLDSASAERIAPIETTAQTSYHQRSVPPEYAPGKRTLLESNERLFRASLFFDVNQLRQRDAVTVVVRIGLAKHDGDPWRFEFTEVRLPGT